MHELKKTLAFVGVAVVLMGTAIAASWPRADRSGLDAERGRPFFPEFKDPLACTELEIFDYDAATGQPLPFKVMLKDGRWVIPSHHNYPADAKDRLARTAAGVIDLAKDSVRSDRPEDFKALGVVDPRSDKLTSPEGVGKRVTLRDKHGRTLADFILGKEVAGHADQRYVRLPDRNRTYAVNLKSEPSARFADWIETNLLKLDSFQVRRITFDNHKVDPEEGTIRRGEVLTLAKGDASSSWALEGGLPADQELDSSKISTLTSALSDLKIVGVRPKPPGLTRELKASGDVAGKPQTQSTFASLIQRGFYPTRDGRLLSNQGDVTVACDDGVVYTLRFGEVTFAQGEALSAGTEGASAAGKDQAKAKKADGGVESRYLLVTAQFDPALIPEPKPAPAATGGELPADPFQRTAEERASKAKEDKEKVDREKADYDRKLADGRKRAQELTDRFADWYYVVPGDAFRSVVLDRAALTRKKTESAGSPPFESSPFPPPSSPH